MWVYKYLKKILIVIMFCIISFGLLNPVTVYAGERKTMSAGELKTADANELKTADAGERKTVRVGWYDSAYNTIDESGYRTGYAYEYQLKLSAYNGWEYEYVKGSWSELLRMLENGEIDLMSDISFTPQREENMLFSTLPMGTEDYYLFISPVNKDMFMTDSSTLNGKKIGVNKDSIQADMLKDWLENNEIQAVVTEVTISEDESLKMVENGELDAYVTVDSFVNPERVIPLFKIGSSDFFFAVSKQRPDLLEDLNYAMTMIQEENKFYNMEMYDKYIIRAGANAFLSAKESEWLSEHETIRVGYQDNYLAFCAKDKNTGELTGVLKDYLQMASECFQNTEIKFKAIGYPTAQDAVRALKDGEVDCVFPANLNGYEAESQGLIMTPSIMDTEMYAIVRISDPNIFSKDKKVIAAVNKGNLNYEAFLAQHYPSWGKEYFKNSEECLKAVSHGEADCLIISNYRYNNISRICDRYHLTAVSLGIKMDYCFAVEKGQTVLYSIMAKVINRIPDASVNASLSHYITEDAKISFREVLADNIDIILIIAIVIVIVILILLILNARSAKKAKKLISATETDDLTGLYNRKYFFQYADRMFREHPDTPMDAVVLNIEQFHSINALHGREVGDRVLQILGSELQKLAGELNGIAGRFEADRFDLYCRPQEDYQIIFDRLQKELNEMAAIANIRMRMGIMQWHKGLEPEQMFDRARTACNMARGHYKKHLIIYDEKISERESYEQRLVNDLNHALDNNEFEIYYQPKFDIQTEPPKLVSAEALVRWRHHELGMISPGDFIPMFEKNGQISLLDKYVWSAAAKQVAEWRDKYGVIFPVSVNLSRVDVFDSKLEETLEGILSSCGLEHNAINLEVTESAYTENADQVIRVVAGLRDKGYEVEMDDFGTGYSSLNMLSYMPIDVLKMDREFIRNLDTDVKNQQLVALILDIADYLKVMVIAEGVETEKQLLLLKNMGCTMVQGYYFSRPLPVEEFEKKFFEK